MASAVQNEPMKSRSVSPLLRRWAPALALGILLPTTLAACGGDDDAPGTKESDSSGTGATDPVVEPQLDSDELYEGSARGSTFTLAVKGDTIVELIADLNVKCKGKEQRQSSSTRAEIPIKNDRVKFASGDAGPQLEGEFDDDTFVGSYTPAAGLSACAPKAIAFTAKTAG